MRVHVGISKCTTYWVTMTESSKMVPHSLLHFQNRLWSFAYLLTKKSAPGL